MSIYLKTSKIKPEWTDYNGHMNLAFYIHIYDTAWEILLQKFNMGEDSAINQKKSTFAVESHTTYDREVKIGEDVDVNLLFLDHDKKRINYKLEMINNKKKYLVSTTEVLSLYVDLKARKVINFDPEKEKLIDDFIEENKKDFSEYESNLQLMLISKLKK